jgi:hypothetical protein
VVNGFTAVPVDFYLERCIIRLWELFLNHASFEKPPQPFFSGDAMATARLNPLNDYLFRKIMGEKGDEEQILSFLNEVLKQKVKNRLVSVEIIEKNKMNIYTL